MDCRVHHFDTVIGIGEICVFKSGRIKVCCNMYQLKFKFVIINIHFQNNTYIVLYTITSIYSLVYEWHREYKYS